MGRIIPLILCLLLAGSLQAQITIRGQVTDAKSKTGLSGTTLIVVETNQEIKTKAKGNYELDVLVGHFTLLVYHDGYRSLTIPVETAKDTTLMLALDRLTYDLEEVHVNGESGDSFGMTSLNQVEGLAIYAAKKTELLEPEKMAANKATNNARQIFGRVPGLNIWESDAGGLQLGIGARGLSPDRTSNFNTRQNGYDIAADALGYPESYYTPPTQALKRIEVVRGAASLQYGTQFGGVLNFVMKEAPNDDLFGFETSQTVGSWGLFNSFNSIHGTNDKLSYYAFVQYKQGDGWRENSDFDQLNAYGSLRYEVSEKTTLRFELTHMDYLAHQPGGLTDRQFEADPRQSNRSRNWFKVNWNIAAIKADIKFNSKTRLDTRFFGLWASRMALGNLDRIDRIDIPDKNRTLILGEFNNVGNETRLMHNYVLNDRIANFLVGVRLYQGNSLTMQGDADATSNPNFDFISPDNLEGSDYTFPSTNVSVFAENIFRLNDHWSVTPGIRYEHIVTQAAGWYKQVVRNLAGEIISEQKFEEERYLSRDFALFGLGISRKGAQREYYFNVSQNYRAITFNDMRVDNPNYMIDPNLSDEDGFNADLGVRGKTKRLQYDASVFYLAYNNRIGYLTVVDSVSYIEKRLKTNIGNSTTVGLEAYASIALWRSAKDTVNQYVEYFANVSALQAFYTTSQDALVEGKQVELVPPASIRTGLTYCKDRFKVSYQFSFVAKQYTDAYNTETPTPNAIAGPIPSYMVSDLSIDYGRGKWTFEGGVNNLFDQAYFTRRATGYPGPGIIPSDGRSFYLSIGLKL